MTLLAHPGHTLVKHLAATAEKAAEFARHFGGEKQARLAGMFHDLGKEGFAIYDIGEEKIGGQDWGTVLEILNLL